jgi:CBS-domain-containing membrane protein
VLGASQFLQMGAGWTLTIVGANAFISLLLALIINNALPRRHYPQAPAKPQVAARVLPEQLDIEHALAEEDSLLDISTEDLLDLYARAQRHAQTRFESSAR